MGGNPAVRWENDMPKVSDLKAYYRQLAVDAGLDEAKIKQVMDVMDDEKFAKTFTERFKPLPDYSHDLDEVRNKTKLETKTEVENGYKAWQTQEMEKYNEYVKGIDALKAYETKYGPLDPDDQTRFLENQNQNRGGTMTKEDIDRIKAEIKKETDESFARRDTAVLELLDVRETHMNTFKKSLDVKAFEAAWKEHPEWGGTIRSAYKEYIAPEMDKIRETQTKEELERRYQEGVRDGFTRKQVRPIVSPEPSRRCSNAM